MDKVKVSREVAEAITKLRESKYTNKAILKFHFNDSEFCNGEVRVLREIETDTLVTALYAGYEVELTPQDKIKELFEKNLDMYDQAKGSGLDGEAMFRDGRSDGILRTLEILNVKVPGVNA